ncbi:MAG: glycine dehydrogenase, partial [Actinobacteria bacterium]|nr:glycine dehydrogenase [Actinomycetota bacterium]
ISRLSGLPIANASLYDGATALVEAVNMAAGSTGRNKLVISAGVHPHWRETVRTFAQGTGHQLVIAPLVNGITDWAAVDTSGAAAIVATYPNYLGFLEDLSVPKSLAMENEALFIVCGDPVAAGVLKTAGQWGADIYVGEGQPFGTALSFGGPYLGLFACTEAQIRRLPGRLVGETVDTEGRRAFVTTLRAREQDIRREKATSNVCTNQTLMAVTAAIQLSYLGTQGLREVATRCAQGARYAYDQIVALDGVTPISNQPFFRDFAVSTALPADVVLERLVAEGFLGGLSANSLAGTVDSSLIDPTHTLLISVTEKRTKLEIDTYVAALAKAVK